MSEQKFISPLLEGFTLGAPMGAHDGVRCCPAIKENSDKKYIVKIISVPASQVQMDALLLAGAYRDPADAMDYFKDRAEDIVKEAQLLQTLSQAEGFLPYDGWQIVPITRHRLGYEVYLLSSYKRSLAKQLRRDPVTHLEAINLGLDMCAALSACRQQGALYVDLKPTNIFVSDKKEYRIGDLGFIRLDELSYSALPQKYHSPYTPPEFRDPMAPLNTTADTYALGMILYQLYNDGQLPLLPEEAEADLPSPVNADYEIAELILKAIHPDPDRRWQDPAEMGQALVSYMQRNCVNDVPITPHTPLMPALPPQEAPAEIAPEEEVIQAQPIPEEEAPEAALPEVTTPEEAEPELPAEPEAAPVPDADEAPGEAPEEAPVEAPEEPQPEISDEVSRILSRADDLISHETPAGVVLPEIPEPPDPFAFVLEDDDEPDDSGIPLDPVMEDPQEAEPVKKKAKKSRRFISPKYRQRARRILATLLAVLFLAILSYFGYLYHQLFYLQKIDGITIVGSQQELTVTVDSQADASKLLVTCSDSYGNTKTNPLVEGKAKFTGLLPNTLYTIQVDITGFHKLTGTTSEIFTTEANVSIVSFSAVTGPEDGSAVITFAVDGEEPDEWTVVCTAEGKEPIRETFSGHTATVSGMSVGTVYTLTLEASDNLTLSGETSIEFLPSRLILAQNLHVSSLEDDVMTIRWSSPGDVVVDSWTIRCYNIAGYERHFTVTEPTAMLPGIDSTKSYTIEVTAAGMTQPARTTITENPLNISAFEATNVDDPAAEALELSWTCDTAAPNGGWLVLYTIDGNTIPTVVKTEKTTASISPWIPGARYQISIQAADGTTVFNGVHSLTAPKAASFEKHRLSVDTLTVNLLKTPEESGWRYESISDKDFTQVFASGDSISLVLRSSATFYLPGYKTQVLYVIRDAHGNVISELVSQESISWKTIWSGGDAKAGELDLPKAPTTPGEYVLDLYFDGMSVAHLPFTVME